MGFMLPNFVMARCSLASGRRLSSIRPLNCVVIVDGVAVIVVAVKTSELL